MFNFTKTKITTKQKGYNLENRVARMLKKMMKFNVKQNVMVKDLNGNLSEFDLTYGYFFKRYVECKNYSHPVGLEQVAKFKEVLSLNGIPTRHGIFITTSTFSPRATTIGVKTIDGVQLKRMERTARIYGLTRMATIMGSGVLCASLLYIHFVSPGGLVASYYRTKRQITYWWRSISK